ncbi:MAG: hypothetical protein ACK5LF_23640 [Bacteroides xylanisolvens]
MKVKVLRVFRDKYTKELYSVGIELEFEDEARIEDLTSRGLVEAIEDKTGNDPVLIPLFEEEFEKKTVIKALKSVGESAAWNIKDENLIANIAALDEEKTSALKAALGIE